jgi:hypothetical protein
LLCDELLNEGFKHGRILRGCRLNTYKIVALEWG